MAENSGTKTANIFSIKISSKIFYDYTSRILYPKLFKPGVLRFLDLFSDFGNIICI